MTSLPNLTRFCTYGNALERIFYPFYPFYPFTPAGRPSRFQGLYVAYTPRGCSRNRRLRRTGREWWQSQVGRMVAGLRSQMAGEGRIDAGDVHTLRRWPPETAAATLATIDGQGSERSPGQRGGSGRKTRQRCHQRRARPTPATFTAPALATGDGGGNPGHRRGPSAYPPNGV